jgi:hypothetical protein
MELVMVGSAIPPWARGAMPPPWEGEVPEITDADWRGVAAAYGPGSANAGPEERAWRMRKARSNALVRLENERRRRH